MPRPPDRNADESVRPTPLACSTRLIFVLVGLLLGVASACDDDATDSGRDVVDDASVDLAEEASDDADATTDTAEEPTESVPPNLRQVNVTIQGELASEVDLAGGDVTRILPESTTAEFRVLVLDNETAIEDLVVRVVDGDPPVELAGQVARVANNLWKIDVTIGPGMSLRASAQDEAGNVALSEHALILPTRAEALVDSWDLRFYTEGDYFPFSWPSTFDDDGTWREQMPDTGDEHGGTYEVVDGELRIAERYYTDADGPDEVDETTIEWEQRGEFYVDPLYFSDGPFFRSGSTSGLAGSWERTIETFEPKESAIELAETRTETLVFGTDDTWSETWTGTDYRNGESPIARSWSGTYRIEPNLNYIDAVGDFLVRSVSHIDGDPVSDEPDRFELHVIRLDRLLIQPRTRAHN